MINNFIKNVKACGKLYVVGEYSILTPYQSAIIKNINIFMNASIQVSDNISIYSDMFDKKIEINKKTTVKSFLNNINNYKNENQIKDIEESLYSRYSLILKTIAVFFEYYSIKSEIDLENIEKFHLNITGKMVKNGKKYGIGSSGCVVVLVLRALSEFYNFHLSNDLMFKLASYTLLSLGDNGSMGDVACITYNDTVYYKSFNRDKIKKNIETKGISVIDKVDWGYEIEIISFKNNIIDIDFIVGWTKEPSVSSEMIKVMKKNISKKFLIETEKNVQKIYRMLSNDSILFSVDELKKSIIDCSNLLMKLHPNIVTSKLKRLINSIENINCCAKSSGAGGGDCGIAFLFHNKNLSDDEKNKVRQEIFDKWLVNDIEILYFESIY